MVDPQAFAVIGLFPSPEALLFAVHQLRDGGLTPSAHLGELGELASAERRTQRTRLEAFTPYPVHGLAEALRLPRSPLPGFVLAMGLAGALLALGFQLWTTAVDYPLITGGKPPSAWEPLIPIVFEGTVLFAAFTAGLGMLFLLNGLPEFRHPILKSKAIRAITRDRFALALIADPRLDPGIARARLASAGATDSEVLLRPDPPPPLASATLLKTLGSLAAANLAAGFATWTAVKLMPVLPPMVRMLDQPRLDTQAGSTFFPDGRAMRLPVPGTVARGYLPLGVTTLEEAGGLLNPLPRTQKTLAVGQRAFTERCALCHGPLGLGSGTLTSAYGGKPANLQAQALRDEPDGKIYWVICRGKNAMPGHEADLTPEQRWAVVHYVRALQRAQNALDGDLP